MRNVFLNRHKLGITMPFFGFCFTGKDKKVFRALGSSQKDWGLCWLRESVLHFLPLSRFTVARHSAWHMGGSAGWGVARCLFLFSAPFCGVYQHAWKVVSIWLQRSTLLAAVLQWEGEVKITSNSPCGINIHTFYTSVTVLSTWWDA